MIDVDEYTINVGIIGGGVSGLVTLKELLEEGHRATVFEKANSIGGIFADVYQQGTCVTSTPITIFSDFIGDNENVLTSPYMLTFVEYCKYLDDYAEHFHLKEHIKLRTEVKALWKDHYNRKWKILVNTGEVYDFDRIAICSGVHGHRRMPTLKNAHLFQGTIKHLKDVKRFEDFTDKKVCIVGGGESASDMILAAAKYGKKSFLSIRMDHGFIVPRYVHGDIDGPADLDTSRIHHSIPRAWGRLHTYTTMLNSLIKLYLKCIIFQRGRLTEQDVVRRTGIDMNLKQINTSNIWTTYSATNSSLVEALTLHKDKCVRKPAIKELKTNSIIFEDDSEEQVDEIVCCTGFENRFYFIEESDQADSNLKRVAEDAKISHQLYKHCVHPDLGAELFWIGFARPNFGALSQIVELQARWFALLCSNKKHLPSKFDMSRQITNYVHCLEQQFTSTRINSITSLTDFLIYSDDLSRIIGCRPEFTRIFFTEPKLWLKLMCGCLMGAHYRLTGPHAKPVLAKHMILKTKWAKQTNFLFSIMLFVYVLFWFVFGIDSCRPTAWYPF